MKKIMLSLIVVLALAPSVAAGSAILRPNGNTTYLAWETFTCSQGAKFECVDEVNLDTNDYLVESTSGDKHTFALTALPSGLENVWFRNVTIYYVGEGNFYGDDEIEVFLVNSTTSHEHTGNLLTLPANWGTVSQTFSRNPFSDTSWTYEELNNLEVGMKASDNAEGGGKIAQVWVNVTWQEW